MKDYLYTRRDWLSAASITAILAPQMTSADAFQQDDTLLSLRPLWQKAHATFNHVLAAKTPIEERCFARAPQSPQREDFESDVAYRRESERVFDLRSAICLEEGLDEIERLEGATMQACHRVWIRSSPRARERWQASFSRRRYPRLMNIQTRIWRVQS